MLYDFKITATGEYDFSHTLAFLKRSDREALFFTENDKVIRPFNGAFVKTILEVTGIPGGVRVIARDGEYKHGCREEGADEIKNFVTEWFDLASDLTPFYRMAEKDEILNPLIKKYRGARITRIPDLFEAFCWAVAGQSISLNVTYIIKKLLVENFGTKVNINRREYSFFPEPDKFTGVDTEIIKSAKLTLNKAVTIKTIASLFTDGLLSRERLENMATPEAVKFLSEIKGIGKWTANYVLMRGLGREDAFPLGDAGLVNALKNITGRKEKLSEKEVFGYFTGWQGYEAYATFYLWRSLL